MNNKSFSSFIEALSSVALACRIARIILSKDYNLNLVYKKLFVED